MALLYCTFIFLHIVNSVEARWISGGIFDFRNRRCFSLRGGSYQTPKVKVLKSDIRTLMRIGGWDIEEALAGLDKYKGNVIMANKMMGQEEESKILSIQQKATKILQEEGYDENSIQNALRANFNNITEARISLIEEKVEYEKQFEQAIAQMVSAGWSEDLARKTLADQLEAKLKSTENDSPSPSLSSASNIQDDGENNLKTNNDDNIKKGNISSFGPIHNSAKNQNEMNSIGSNEFEVTDKTFQKLVLESDKPVILDVYAQWCKPCQALTPALSSLVNGSSGKLRLAKLDNDKSVSLTRALQVHSLPTLFVIKKGRVINSIVGVPGRDELASFYLSALAKEEEEGRVGRSSHLNMTTDMDALSSAVGIAAGMASLAGESKFMLENKVMEAIHAIESKVGKEKLKSKIAALTAYLNNLENDIFNIKYNNISMSTDYFQNNVLSIDGLDLFLAIGYTKTMNKRLVLSHRNAGVIATTLALIHKYTSPAAMRQRGESSFLDAMKRSKHLAQLKKNKFRRKQGIEVPKIGKNSTAEIERNISEKDEVDEYDEEEEEDEEGSNLKADEADEYDEEDEEEEEEEEGSNLKADEADEYDEEEDEEDEKGVREESIKGESLRVNKRGGRFFGTKFKGGGNSFSRRKKRQLKGFQVHSLLDEGQATKGDDTATEYSNGDGTIYEANINHLDEDSSNKEVKKGKTFKQIKVTPKFIKTKRCDGAEEKPEKKDDEEKEEEEEPEDNDDETEADEEDDAEEEDEEEIDNEDDDDDEEEEEEEEDNDDETDDEDEDDETEAEEAHDEEEEEEGDYDD